MRSAALVAVTLGLSVVAGAVAAGGADPQHPWLEGIARALTVATPILVGLYARGRPPFARFGSLLVTAGCVCFVASLSGSPNEVVYSVGRVGGWLVELTLVYVVLAFPSGRLPAREDRLIVGAMAFVVATLYLPTVPLVESFPVPSPWGGCEADCPRNAFALVEDQPAFVENIVRPLREVLTVAIFAAATLRLTRRLLDLSHVMRRTLAPVLVVAIFRLLVFSTAIVSRRADPDSELVEVTGWLIALSVPALAVAFLVGVGRWRLFLAHAMRDLATHMPGRVRPQELQVALAQAFDDPSIEIVYWLGHNGDAHWVDAEGRPFVPPGPASGRRLTEVVDGGARLGAIVHDVALGDDEAFVATATSYMRMTLDNQRLAAQAGALLREVRSSRARIQATADDERRRIERDLHDGAQQRLVALRVKLALAAEQTAAEDPRRADLLRSLGTEMEEAIDEVRSLAQGIYPSALADRGLVEALRSAALRSPLPTTVLAAGVGRYSREVETTTYFCCLEALQNATKHAEGATATVIELSDTGTLRFEVGDDGAGFDPSATCPGAGFTNMRDRVSAVGGELTIVSSPGKGARIIGTIPPRPSRP
jgi:signal transduction histidine kinase